MERPENWFEDFGAGQLIHGESHIELESGFASVVNSDQYHVFVTKYDDNDALYVFDRTSKGFTVEAKSSKTAHGTFSYRIVAKRKDISGARLEKVDIPEHKNPTVRIPRIVERPKPTAPVQSSGRASRGNMNQP